MDRVKGLSKFGSPSAGALLNSVFIESQSATDAPYSTEGVPFLSSELHI